MSNETLVSVNNMKKYFDIKGGFLGEKKILKAVDGISFSINRGETLSIVGESGCGKSTTGRLLLRLLDLTDGQVNFEGNDISNMTQEQIRPLRKNMQMIFQDPYSSLNPRIKVRDLIAEPLLTHTTMTKIECYEKVNELLEVVGLHKESALKYPHEFSGGQRQRIGIARAISVNPKLIVADEPVSALDVSIQSQILNLMQDLQEKYNLTYFFISHNLSVVEHISNRICVMYLGKIVEVADRDSLYKNPSHPYTKALLSAVPIPDPRLAKKRVVLKGDIPSPVNPPTGCTFHTRCPNVMEKCKVEKPSIFNLDDNHSVYCHLFS